MFSLFNRKTTLSSEKMPPPEIPLMNMKEIDQEGILYIDGQGIPTIIYYSDAYKGWCKSKNVRQIKPRYICDRTKYDGWKLIFYTDPQITFRANPSQEELWIDIIRKITLQGYVTFDCD